ncbi:hypothetical protein DL89DRAFT_253984 [Linderina pennispora]|uniref:Malonyl-CoA:ACP transacylase (MAT) domain-containing protein n=1 Tax=Linderina pennispora TaxID=61395 RepID=A0A1Y1WLB2_9FUNG|nr:uncharacterized protein DL89DRAFT_253984 [Linderina pennispora]ORX74098.1 hypothetical protein DL89DRAFT_253984 [Linderina pennispora]
MAVMTHGSDEEGKIVENQRIINSDTKYATTVNEPVKDILDRVYTRLMENLNKRESNKDPSPICTVEYLAPEPSPVSLPTSVAVAVDESSRTYRLPTDAALLPNPDVWLEALAGPSSELASCTSHIASGGFANHYIEGRDLSYRNAYLRVHGHAVGSGDINSVGIEQHFSADALKSFTISQELVQKYCSSTHITSKYYKMAADESQLAPMDIFFGIGISQLTSILTTPPLHRGLLGIIHLSHSTNYQVSLTALENIESGQKISFTSRFYRKGNLIAICEDVLVIRGQYAAYNQMFRSMDEPVRRMQTESDEDATALGAKEWFIFKDGSEPLSIMRGDVLEFRLHSHYQFKSNEIYSKIKTAGPVYRLLPSGEYEHIADVYYENNDAYDNYVIQFLNESQLSDASTVNFEYDSTLVLQNGISGGLSFKAPSVNWEFAHASGDQSMAHTNPYVAAYTGESEMTCHRMWTSAASRAVVERVVADSDPRRMRSYSVQFVGNVYPNDKLRVELVHAGMNNWIHDYQWQDSEVAQAKTAYVFTGQGSQFVGMGMDLYMSSTAARDVWDRADRHMLKKYGVSLLKIVQENPREYLVKSGGKKGITNSYTLPLFEQLIPEITRSSKSYTHRCSNGLLNATLFTQPIQTVMSLAQAADMRAHGLIQDDAIFAGHSLGEFGSLAAIAEIVSVEDAVDIALYRGLLLHASVDRDTNGRSQYAMASINPQRVLPGFSELHLLRIVDCIRERKQQLLEVINYNVQGQQYVVTGHVESLNDMCLIAHELSKRSLSSAELEEGNILQDIIDGILSATPDMQLQEDSRMNYPYPWR